ncbi:hypothetical protein OS493_027891 [Desmophyllum pertusum]|uniref:Uncharacterized protein n=1 Tax=Desmophyllum pertusum TaxID=174260 RepID=A0A9W9YNI6_9CNID|nr:hypothetical protein OS493_027891 [Desmophyllum pertusum]
MEMEKEKNKKEKEEEQKEEGYFAKDKRKKMTVVFHAVLAPHFKFEKNQGDRIFMRFGGVAFGEFHDDVVEVHPERNLENDFILVQAKLLVPCDYVSDKRPYKYIVFKAKRKDSEKDEHLWDYLIDWGHTANRCLQIPKDRCQTGAVWHQYDDTIFSPPGKFQSFRNTIPIECVKSMGTVKGRSIATFAMLGEVNFTNWEAVEAVNDIAYCMKQTMVEKGGEYKNNVPSSYNFYTILKEFIKAKIKKSEAEDKTDLVSSVSIAYIIYVHSVYTNLDPEDYKRLFFSLILRPDPKEQTCIAFESLLDRIPCEQWQNLGEAIRVICRHASENHHDRHDWLFAVPLVHFLTQVSQPFSNSVLLMEKPKDKDDTWWGASGFDTESMRKRTFTKNRYR